MMPDWIPLAQVLATILTTSQYTSFAVLQPVVIDDFPPILVVYRHTLDN